MATSKSPPLWRKAVDAVDGIVTPAANQVVRTNAFADVAAAGIRLESRLRRRIERNLAAVWHLFNLPTASDQRSIRSQLVAIEARLRDLTEQLDGDPDS